MDDHGLFLKLIRNKVSAIFLPYDSVLGCSQMTSPTWRGEGDHLKVTQGDIAWGEGVNKYIVASPLNVKKY